MNLLHCVIFSLLIWKILFKVLSVNAYQHVIVQQCVILRECVLSYIFFKGEVLLIFSHESNSRSTNVCLCVRSSIRLSFCHKSKPHNSIKSIIPPSHNLHHNSHHHMQHHTKHPTQHHTHTSSLTQSHTPSHMLSHTLSNKPSTTTNTTKPHTIVPPLIHPSSSFNFATFKLFSLLDSFRLWNFVKSIILALDMEV